MNNIWIVILVVFVLLVASWFLAQVFIPLGYIGLLVAIIITVLYLKNKPHKH